MIYMISYQKRTKKQTRLTTPTSCGAGVFDGTRRIREKSYSKKKEQLDTPDKPEYDNARLQPRFPDYC